MELEEFVFKSVMMKAVVRMRPAERVDCSKTTLEKATARAFYIALMLTGSCELAEQSVIEAIDLGDFNPGFEEKLWLFAVAASLRPQIQNRVVRVAEAEAALRLLPKELRRIVYHSPPARQSFVLRFIVGLKPDECAAMLALSADQVNEYAGIVLHDLSNIEFANTVRDLAE